MVAQYWHSNNLSNDDATLATSLDIQKSRAGSDLLDNITRSIQSCLSHMCDKWPDCTSLLKRPKYNDTIFTSPDAFFYINNHPDLTSELRPAVDPFLVAFDVCAVQKDGLNPDIGGIGVSCNSPLEPKVDDH